MLKRNERFRQQLLSGGIPVDFSVVPAHQTIPDEVLADIDRFIEVFEVVTNRPAWVEAVLGYAPLTAQPRRRENCFFSAWDIHLPPGKPQQWQLIEFNDNGSGFLFAGIINSAYYDLYLSGQGCAVAARPLYTQLCDQIRSMIAAETAGIFGRQPGGLLLILDDQASLETGKFRHEHELMEKLASGLGWQSAIGSPESLVWNGSQLLFKDSSGARAVSFVINRSTDFFWQGEVFAPLLSAYRAGYIYVAPNPNSYATRSDKRLLEYLSRPVWDDQLGILPCEREILSRHIPPTYRLTESNLDDLAERKADLVFKPAHGHASLGVLDSHKVGRHRLKRLLAKGYDYVAQHVAEKSELRLNGNLSLWTDLRVWAYRGKRYQIIGRASNCKSRLDLTPPGGWLPTFAGARSFQQGGLRLIAANPVEVYV